MSGVWWFTLGGLATLYALLAWRNRRFSLRVDEAAKGSAVIADEWN
jgi:hypothetical protein